MTKVTLPPAATEVMILNSRFLVTLPGGQQVSYRFEDLTEEQENVLRLMAGPMKQRREVKAVRESGKAKKRINYAAREIGR